MLYFNKIFKIPGPKDLGMAKSNHAMASSLFNNSDEPTWEDYHNRIKKEYPVKYFLSSTFPSFFVKKYKKVSNYISEIYYWIKCHINKRYKYHLLDLTQPKIIKITKADGSIREIYNQDYFQYGWRDTDNRMLYAMFNLLNDFVKNELYLNFFTEEDLKKDASFQQRIDQQNEILAIHHWWNIERKLQQEKINILTGKWSFLSDKKRKQTAARVSQEIINEETALENKTDEMIERLMKIRRLLWS